MRRLLLQSSLVRGLHIQNWIGSYNRSYPEGAVYGTSCGGLCSVLNSGSCVDKMTMIEVI